MILKSVVYFRGDVYVSEEMFIYFSGWKCHNHEGVKAVKWSELFDNLSSRNLGPHASCVISYYFVNVIMFTKSIIIVKNKSILKNLTV